jgi:hypothetical protein
MNTNETASLRRGAHGAFVALALVACGDNRSTSDADASASSDATADIAPTNDAGADASDADGDACAPRCEGVECGDDGCGGICGACAISLTCTAGRCAVPPGGCVPGVERSCYKGPAGTDRVGRCRSGRQICSPFGRWPNECEGEVLPVFEVCGNGVDDDCNGDADEQCTTFATTLVRGRVTFERRRANEARTAWGPIETVDAAGFAVYAMRGDTMIGEAVTTVGPADAGRFELRVAAALEPEDRIVVAALVGRDGALELTVASPELPRGAWSAFRRSSTMPPRTWSWSWSASEVIAAGPVLRLHIDEEKGSGVANVFDVARATVDAARRAYPDRPRRSLLMWMDPGVEWSCGACFTAQPGEAFGQSFAGQIAFPSGANETHWASAVAAHEVGHWVMNSYGISPMQGGAHSFNMTLRPGLAWSEGYATWFGAVARNDSVYLDRQGGTMFWSDIAARRFGRGGAELSPWTRPDPRAGVLQGISEEEVAAILWAIEPTGARAALHRAFASPRMTVRPFARGFISEFGGSSPILPDFLDALVCGGVPAARIDAATRGDFPYPSSAPDCRVGTMATESPLALSWRVERQPERDADGLSRVTLVARAEQRSWLPGPLRATITAPPAVHIEEDSAPWSIAATGPNTVSERRFTVRYPNETVEPLTFAASARAESMGVHGEALWRWGRPEPTVLGPTARGPALVVRGRNLGASISMQPSAAEMIHGGVRDRAVRGAR